eukprot:1158628-Pelagomonas_calceolata.AAC.3
MHQHSTSRAPMRKEQALPYANIETRNGVLLRVHHACMSSGGHHVTLLCSIPISANTPKGSWVCLPCTSAVHASLALLPWLHIPAKVPVAGCNGFV